MAKVLPINSLATRCEPKSCQKWELGGERGFLFWPLNSVVEWFFYKEQVGGSNPSGATKQTMNKNLENCTRRLEVAIAEVEAQRQVCEDCLVLCTTIKRVLELELETLKEKEFKQCL